MRSPLHRKALVGLADAADRGVHLRARKLCEWLELDDVARVDRVLIELVWDRVLFVDWRGGARGENVYYHLHAGRFPEPGTPAGDRYARLLEGRRRRDRERRQRRGRQGPRKVAA